MTQELVVPTTGEVIALEDAEQCARVLVELRELKDRIKELEAELKASIIERSRTDGTKTLHFAGMTATVTASAAIEWDQEVLLELLDAGLPEKRFNDLVKEEVSYKVDGSVAKSIAGSNEKYAEIIERAKRRIERTPSVTMKVTG